jgi:RimJ/RimL family protein N-acetyltransferase
LAEPPNQHWLLQPATTDDIDGLHALSCKPLVYRYLFDAEPPSRDFIADRVARSLVNMSEMGVGMWVLEDLPLRYAGCVELRPYPAPGCVELTYLLDPMCWGRGLALRMAWTAIARAFALPSIDAVIAGADAPNAKSFAVMRRLGMQFHKDVEYPLGAGAEYILRRGAEGPMPRPELLPLP